MVMSMKKRLLSFFLVLAIVLYCAMSVFAVDTGVDIIDDPLSYYFQNQLLGTYKGTGVSLYCPECDYKVEYTGGTLVTCPYDGAQLLLAGKYGVKATPIDMKNAGSNVPPGGRNPKGYQNETGVPSVNSSGCLYINAQYYGFVWDSYYIVGIFSYKSIPSKLSNCNTNISGSGTSAGNNNIFLYYTFTAPYSGVYYIANGSNLDFGSYQELNGDFWHSIDLSLSVSTDYYAKMVLNKGQTAYLEYDSRSINKGLAYKYSFSPSIPVVCEPLGDSAVVNKQTNITINNNTWNGNIYTDNSTNLTYIYPQYTVNNETKISNNPIIYNEETKQYYTYDSVTNNYYYITYSDPAPTPTPSPSPDPGGSGGGDNPSGGGSSGSGSGDTPSGGGSSWWEKLLDKLGSAIIDGLLGAISAILKLIFKLLSTILGWIIWLVSQVLTLFPFLPPGLGALLIGGVVVCFVIGIIKFIRG